MAVIAHHSAFLMFSMASRASHVFTIVMRGVRIGLMWIGWLCLFSEILPRAMTCLTSLVIWHNKRVASYGIFLCMTNGTVSQSLVMGLHFSGTSISTERKKKRGGRQRTS